MTPPDYSASITNATLPSVCQSPSGGDALALDDPLPDGRYYIEFEFDHSWLIDASVGSIVVQANVGIDTGAPVFDSSAVAGLGTIFSNGGQLTPAPGTIDAFQFNALNPNDGPDQARAIWGGCGEVVTAGILSIFALVQGSGNLTTNSQFSASINVWKLA